MKIGMIIVGMVLALSACGGNEQASTASNVAAQQQADVAKASLQEKADALARQGSMSPPPPAEKKEKKK